MAHQRPTRAYLAVPAHRTRLVAKAAASAADAVFMDLEDAVPPSEKGVALEQAVRALASLDWGSKRVTVRISASMVWPRDEARHRSPRRSTRWRRCRGSML